METRSVEPRLVVHSWDYDGMLASPNLSNKMKELILRAAKEGRALTKQDFAEAAEMIIKNNEDFFNHRFSSNGMDRHVVFIGSDRQDVRTDNNNGFKAHDELFITFSCYPIFEALVEKLSAKYKLDIKLDTLLLEDFYSHQNPGTTFTRANEYYQNLDPNFISQLANFIEQLAKYDNMSTEERKKHQLEIIDLLAAANKLFVNFRKDLIGKLGEHELKYSDKQKLLIMYAQMHHANTEYAKGNPFIYRYADDRNDILSLAQEKLADLLGIFPKDVIIFLEQYIASDIRKHAVKLSQDDLFSSFRQQVPLKGEGNKVEAGEDILLDLTHTHSVMNEVGHGVPTILKEAVDKRRREKPFNCIKECAQLLMANDKSEGVAEILKLAQSEVASSTDAANLLKKIKSVANEKLASKSKRGGEAAFFKSKPALAQFYRTLQGINPADPDIEALLALKEILTTPQQPSLGRNSRILKK